ncbi:MAG TPA: hypothetical protein VGG39_37570 [Polyangiaceae bacterium]|jgi:hypothetical protein
MAAKKKKMATKAKAAKKKGATKKRKKAPARRVSLAAKLKTFVLPQRLRAKFPPQEEIGSCEIRITDDGKLWCDKIAKGQCDKDGGNCGLFSVPKKNPEEKPREEDQPATPKGSRYYFCKCMPQL